MTGDNRMPQVGLLRGIKTLWTILVVIGITAFAAAVGLQVFGVVGALALGLIGLCLGAVLCFPSQLRQLFR